MQPKMPASARRRAKVLQTIVQRIATGGNQIAGHQRHVGTRFVGHADGAFQFALGSRNGLKMDVRQLHQAQPVQIVRQTGNCDGLCSRRTCWWRSMNTP